LVIHGKADTPVYIKIDDNGVELKNADHLRGKGAITTRQMIKDQLDTSYHIVAVGPAGENGVVFATILAESDSSGSGGLGAVMGSKNLKAIAVKGTKKIQIANKERVGELRKKIKEVKGPSANGPELLPGNYKKSICFGCINGCIRSNYTDKTGQTGKTMCQSGLFYTVRAQRFYQEMNDVPFQATKMCDDYGLDTYPVQMAMQWLVRCYKSGILSEEETQIPLSKIGSLEFIETLVISISLRQGLGDQLADGIRNTAATMGNQYEDLLADYITKTDAMQVYDPRLYLTTGLFWATEPRLPIHQLHEISRPLIMWAAKACDSDLMGLAAADNYMTSDVVQSIGEKFWGGAIAADFSTYEGKALAAATIQNRQYLQESLILCDMSWPIIHSKVTPDHVGDPTLGPEILSAVAGRELDHDEIEQLGKRIHAVQRADHIRDGHNGRQDDVLEEFHFTVGIKGDFLNDQCIVPGKNGEVYSRKGMTLDRKEFEKMKDEYYQIRGWDVASGLPTRKSLEDLDLKEIADTLDEEGKLGED